jgi:hypothetical protein
MTRRIETIERTNRAPYDLIYVTPEEHRQLEGTWRLLTMLGSPRALNDPKLVHEWNEAKVRILGFMPPRDYATFPCCCEFAICTQREKP